MQWWLSSNAPIQEKMTLYSSGILHLPHYSAGSMSFDGSSNIVSSSDLRLKENIRPFTRGLADIMALPDDNFILFTYKGDESGKVFAGIAAQRQREALPETIHEGPDGFLNRDNNAEIAVLMIAVRELKRELDEAKKEIAELKAGK